MKRIMLLLMMILIFAVESLQSSALLCTKMEAGKTMNNQVDALLGVGAGRFLAMNFNATGSNSTELLLSTGNADSKYYFWNGTAWDLDRNATGQVGLEQGLLSGSITFSFVYNFTGNEKWMMFYESPIDATKINATVWNGSAWVSNASFIFSVEWSMAGQAMISARANMPETGKHSILVSDGGPGAFSAWQWNGSNMTSNNTILVGLNSSSHQSIQFAQNFSGRNRLNAIMMGPNVKNAVRYWNGSEWLNETGMIESFSDTFLRANLQENFNMTGNVTVFTGDGNYNLWYSGRFEYPGDNNFMSMNISSNIVTKTNSVINVTTFSWCNATSMKFAINETGAFTTKLNQTITPSTQSVTRFFNTSDFSACSRTLSLMVNVTDIQNNSVFNTTNVLITPTLYSSNASAYVSVDLTCNSGTNATITANVSAVLNVTLNMSAIFIGSNATCPYGASRAGSVRTENKSSGCSVFVFEVNLTTTLNSTVGEASEISGRGIGNIPVAVGAAAIATLIVVYTVTRKRRGE